MTSGIFHINGMLRSTVVARSCVSLRSFAVPCFGSHLFGAVCCSGALENADFLGDDIPVYFRMQRLFARQWIHVWRQFLVSVRTWHADIIFGSGRLLFLGLKSTWFGISWEILPETFPYPAVSGLTVDTWLRQFMRRLDRTVPKPVVVPQVQFLAGGSHARFGMRQWWTCPSLE